MEQWRQQLEHGTVKLILKLNIWSIELDLKLFFFMFIQNCAESFQGVMHTCRFISRKNGEGIQFEGNKTKWGEQTQVILHKTFRFRKKTFLLSRLPPCLCKVLIYFLGKAAQINDILTLLQKSEGCPVHPIWVKMDILEVRSCLMDRWRNSEWN